VDPSWVHLLRPLVERDQFIRDALERRGILEDRYHPELEKVHRENAEKLKAMIERMGFPVLSNAGEEGVRLSWFIIHHAFSYPDFMREGLLQMRLAAANEDYPREHLASTEDRVLYLEGKSQIYGTNYDWSSGEYQLTEVEDPQFLDHRRKAMDLAPIGESLLKIWHFRPPRDELQRGKEFHEWLRSKGWRT
jgi:hypothetical protein